MTTALAPTRPVGARRSPGRLHLPVVVLLLVASSVSWRRGTYFSGSLDPVVAAKGLLSVAALLLAFHTAQKVSRLRLGSGTMWFVAVLLAGSVFGALTHGTLAAGGLVAVRVAVLAVTVRLVLRYTTTREFFGTLAWWCGAVALVSSVTGLPTLASGRLSGGVPTLSPNELALLAGVLVLHLAWLAVLEQAHLLHAVAGVAALGVIWVTGSRTGLLMLLVALAVMALHLRRAGTALVAGALAAAAVLSVGIAATGALTSFAERDGAGTSTLDSRFIAWRAAATWAETGWQLVFGGGLSVKIIQIRGQWWTEQPLDSSWVSALVQGGLLGIVVAAAWVLWTLRGALRSTRQHRALFLGLLIYLVGRSFLESGLFDATPAFLALVAVSMLAEGGSRERTAAEPLQPAPSGADEPGNDR